MSPYRSDYITISLTLSPSSKTLRVSRIRDDDVSTDSFTNWQWSGGTYDDACDAYEGEDERHVRLRPRQRVVLAERCRGVATAQNGS